MGIGRVLTVLLDLCFAELLQHTTHMHNQLNGDNAQAVSLKLTTRLVVIGHVPCSCQGLVVFRMQDIPSWAVFGTLHALTNASALVDR